MYGKYPYRVNRPPSGHVIQHGVQRRRTAAAAAALGVGLQAAGEGRAPQRSLLRDPQAVLVGQDAGDAVEDEG